MGKKRQANENANIFKIKWMMETIIDGEMPFLRCQCMWMFFLAQQWLKPVFTSLTSLSNFSARKCCRERNECTSFVAVLGLCGEWWQEQQYNVEKQVFLDLPCDYEHCLKNATAAISVIVRTIYVRNFSQFVITNIRSYRKARFWKYILKNTRRIPEN